MPGNENRMNWARNEKMDTREINQIFNFNIFGNLLVHTSQALRQSLSHSSSSYSPSQPRANKHCKDRRAHVSVCVMKKFRVCAKRHKNVR